MKSAYSVSVTKRNRRRLMRLFSFVGILGLIMSWMPINHANAVGVLGEARDYMSRNQAAVTTGITHQIFFKTTSAVAGGASNNKVIILFPDGDDTQWCRTAGSVTVTLKTDPTGATETATGLPGAFTSSTCAQGSGSGSADSNSDRLLINTVTDLGATTRYGLQVVGNAGVLGTATAAGNNIKIIVKTNNGTVDVDSFTIATSLVTADQYTVSASIDPTLTVALSATTVNLGTLTATNVSYQGVTSTVTTNARTGYVSLVVGSTVTLTDTNSADTIAVAAGSVTAGTSGYGVSTSASTQTIATASGGLTPSCSTSVQTKTGGPYNASSLTTALQQFASSATPTSAEATTLCFLVAISGTQAPGAYTNTVTLVTTAKF